MTKRGVKSKAPKRNQLSLVLPEPLSAYFAAANRDDAEALGQCFVDHAVVKDEGRTIEGPTTIKQWHVEMKKKYHHTIQPIDVVERDCKRWLSAGCPAIFRRAQ